jgi:hypothetical protein
MGKQGADKQNCALQQCCAERHLETHNLLILFMGGILDDHTGFHCYQLKTRSGSSGYAITNTGQLSGKTLPGT